MADCNQQQRGFTDEEFAKFKQKHRNTKLSWTFASIVSGIPLDDKEEEMMKVMEEQEQNEHTKLIKNKWIVLSPIGEPIEFAIEAKYDTGAVSNFLTERMVQFMGLDKERLDQPQDITTATGPSGVCEYHVVVNWRGMPGCHGEVEFFILPETSTLSMPLIGTDAQKCWDELLNEQPKGVTYYTALGKQKAPEKIEGAALRAAVQNEHSQLRRKKEVHEERRGGSSSKSKGSRANEKKTKRN